jgi:hypothetical protein
MKNRLFLLSLFVILSMFFSACAPAITPTEEPPAVTEIPTEPPGATETIPDSVQPGITPAFPPGHLGTVGAHASLACDSCHKNGMFKGTDSSCAACHSEPDFHAGKFGTDCAACHTPTEWSSVSYEGPHTFPMDHNGADGQCATCHPDGLTTYTCFNCHNDEEITDEHDEDGISDINDCMDCHNDGRKPDD